LGREKKIAERQQQRLRIEQSEGRQIEPAGFDEFSVLDLFGQPVLSAFLASQPYSKNDCGGVELDEIQEQAADDRPQAEQDAPWKLESGYLKDPRERDAGESGFSGGLTQILGVRDIRLPVIANLHSRRA